MTTPVLSEFDQGRNDVSRCEADQEYLAVIDAYSTALTGVISLDDAGAETGGSIRGIAHVSVTPIRQLLLLV